MTEPFEPARLMVVIACGESAEDRLGAALAAGPVASVVITPGSGKALDPGAARALVALAQSRDAAALIAGDARLARTLKADGVHVAVSDAAEAAYAEAREIVGGRVVVGLEAGASRHDAMAVGEAGAEYIAFGVPAADTNAGEDRAVACARRLELIGWWAEIFEVPCVAFDVATPEEAADLACAGADFIAVTLPVAASPAAVQEHVRAIARAIAEVSSPAPEDRA